MMMITFRLLGSYQSLCNQTWRLILACSAFIRFNFLSYLQLMTGGGLGVMDLCVTIKGVSFLLQTSMGILENAVVLLAYAHIIYGEPRLLPVDVILCHLAPANLMLLLTRCIPQTMTVFGLRDLLNDAGCKAVIYACRISRALSVCLTCMLSVFQAVTIAPAGPRSSRLKHVLPSLVLPTFVGLWLLNMAICTAAPFFSTKWNSSCLHPQPRFLSCGLQGPPILCDQRGGCLWERLCLCCSDGGLEWLHSGTSAPPQSPGEVDLPLSRRRGRDQGGQNSRHLGGSLCGFLQD